MKLHNIEPHPIERSASRRVPSPLAVREPDFPRTRKRSVVLRGGVKFYAASHRIGIMSIMCQ